MDKIMQMPLGALAANCYIIPGDDNKVIAVDPASVSEVIAVLDSQEAELGAIIITHGHFDHFAGAAELSGRTGAPIYAPDLDAEMLSSSDKSWAWFMQGTPFAPVTPDKTFTDGEEFTVCGVTFRVMAAPGHTAGSCLLFCDKYGVVLSGDVIFHNSIGRTDGYSGSDRQMAESLARIAALPGNPGILSGHGDVTDLETEKRCNPYLR
ncbi:MAG: MBL fold metallo-hydrolase [Oscillospiraceae bacterium]|nr:MBL fold metallo-hydrolase [Oscillospiraceae bacterium]